MKRLMIGIAATTLLGGGLVATSAETAQAACPYTGCVPTSLTIQIPNAPVAKGGKAKICIKVSTSGSGQPKGRVNVAVRKRSGGPVFADSKKYEGKTCFRTGKLRGPGKYLVRAVYQASASGAFGDSSNSAAFRVVK